MQEFDYKIEYIKGKENIVADALSRKQKEIKQTSSSIIKKLLNVASLNVEVSVLNKLDKEYH